MRLRAFQDCPGCQGSVDFRCATRSSTISRSSVAHAFEILVVDELIKSKTTDRLLLISTNVHFRRLLSLSSPFPPVVVPGLVASCSRLWLCASLPTPSLMSLALPTKTKVILCWLFQLTLLDLMVSSLFGIDPLLHSGDHVVVKHAALVTSTILSKVSATFHRRFPDLSR